MQIGGIRLFSRMHGSRDSKELGNVIAVDDDNIVLNQDNIEFKIPKSYVEGYRGNAVFLGLNGKDIQYYQS